MDQGKSTALCSACEQMRLFWFWEVQLALCISYVSLWLMTAANIVRNCISLLCYGCSGSGWNKQTTALHFDFNVFTNPQWLCECIESQKEQKNVHSFCWLHHDNCSVCLSVFVCFWICSLCFGILLLVPSSSMPSILQLERKAFDKTCIAERRHAMKSKIHERQSKRDKQRGRERKQNDLKNIAFNENSSWH